MARQKKEEQDAGLPAWLATYGDLMSLLLVFFILIVSFSSVQDVSFKKAMGSLDGALSFMHMNSQAILFEETYLIIHPGASMLLKRGHLKAGSLEEEFTKIAEKMELAAIKEEVTSALQVLILKEEIHILIDSNLLFKSASDELQEKSLPFLKRIAKIVKRVPFPVKIEGHTDDIAIKTKNFSSNWDLSVKRALSVLELLVLNGVHPEKLSISGYGEYRPIASNNTASGRARNRRVELVIYQPTDDNPYESVPQRQGSLIIKN